MIESLASSIAGRQRRRIRRRQRAAVLVPIVDDGGPLRLVLTRRAEDLPTHGGQVAFPGGYIEKGDAGPEGTALREAEEEIGLPASSVELIGLLDDHTTWDGRVAVTAVAGRLVEPPALEPRSSEVARVFEIPVEELCLPGRWTSKPDPLRGSPHLLHYFEHDGETLWGLSARIVIHLLELAGLPGPRTPRGA